MQLESGEIIWSEHIPNYYVALEDTTAYLDIILKLHRLLMEKMHALPEVQEYLKNRPLKNQPKKISEQG